MVTACGTGSGRVPRAKDLVNGVEQGGTDAFPQTRMTLSETQEIVHVKVHVGEGGGRKGALVGSLGGGR